VCVRHGVRGYLLSLWVGGDYFADVPLVWCDLSGCRVNAGWAWKLSCFLCLSLLSSHSWLIDFVLRTLSTQYLYPMGQSQPWGLVLAHRIQYQYPPSLALVVTTL